MTTMFCRRTIFCANTIVMLLSMYSCYIVRLLRLSCLNSRVGDDQGSLTPYPEQCTVLLSKKLLLGSMLRSWSRTTGLIKFENAYMSCEKFTSLTVTRAQKSVSNVLLTILALIFTFQVIGNKLCETLDASPYPYIHLLFDSTAYLCVYACLFVEWIDGSRGKIIYAPCRTGVYAPDDWDGSLANESMKVGPMYKHSILSSECKIDYLSELQF